MKVDVTYSCGHVGEIEVYGERSKREWMIRRASEGICEECQLKQDLARIEELKTEQEALGLPELTGSDKVYVRKGGYVHRKTFLSAMDNFMAMCEGTEGGRMAVCRELKPFGSNDEQRAYYAKRNVQMAKAIKEAMLRITSASYWNSLMVVEQDMIDFTRLLSDYYSENKSLIDQMIKAAESGDGTPVEDPIITAEPDDPKTTSVAEIVVTEECVRLYSPKDDTIIEAARKLRMQWLKSYWGLSRTVRTGDMMERAREVIATLLSRGIPVKADRELIADAIAGKYEPYTPRWVTARGDSLIVWLDGNDDLYRSARKLKGAEYDGGCFRVPLTSWREVADFARFNNYKISDKAEASMERAKEEEHQRMAVGTVKVKTPDKRTEKDTLKDLLNSSTEVLDDLKDS